MEAHRPFFIPLFNFGKCARAIELKQDFWPKPSIIAPVKLPLLGEIFEVTDVLKKA